MVEFILPDVLSLNLNYIFVAEEQVVFLILVSFPWSGAVFTTKIIKKGPLFQSRLLISIAGCGL
jgi:hypothetical protein